MIGSSRGRVVVVALIAVAVTLASCSDVQEPVVTMTGLDFNGISTEGLSFDLLLDVQNPNTFGASISRLEYEIQLDGVEVATGKQVDAIEVEAGQTVEVGIPFIVVWGGVDKGLKKLLDGQEHEWRLRGSVRLNKGPVSRLFSFSESGDFDAPDADDIEIDFDL